MFLFSFTKKAVNKTVDDSHDLGFHSKIKKKLENIQPCIDTNLHKKIFKSARQNTHFLGEFLGTSIS